MTSNKEGKKLNEKNKSITKSFDLTGCALYQPLKRFDFFFYFTHFLICFLVALLEIIP